MKKLIAMILAVMMVLGMFAACGNKDVAEAPKADAPAADAPAADAPAADAPAVEEAPAQEAPAPKQNAETKAAQPAAKEAPKASDGFEDDQFYIMINDIIKGKDNQ